MEASNCELCAILGQPIPHNSETETCHEAFIQTINQDNVATKLEPFVDTRKYEPAFLSDIVCGLKETIFLQVLKDEVIMQVGSAMHLYMKRLPAKYIQFRMLVLANLSQAVGQSVLRDEESNEQVSTWVNLLCGTETEFGILIDHVRRLIPIVSSETGTTDVLVDIAFIEALTFTGQVLMGIAMKQNDPDSYKRYRDFYKLISVRYALPKSSKLKNIKLPVCGVPLATDLINYHIKSKMELEASARNLQASPNESNYRKLGEVLLSKLHTLNNWRGRTKDCGLMTKGEFDKRVTATEMYRPKVIVVQVSEPTMAKFPVVMTEYIEKKILLLLEQRKNSGIPDSNPFIFVKWLEEESNWRNQYKRAYVAYQEHMKLARSDWMPFENYLFVDKKYTEFVFSGLQILELADKGCRPALHAPLVPCDCDLNFIMAPVHPERLVKMIKFFISVEESTTMDFRIFYQAVICTFSDKRVDDLSTDIVLEEVPVPVPVELQSRKRINEPEKKMENQDKLAPLRKVAKRQRMMETENATVSRQRDVETSPEDESTGESTITAASPARNRSSSCSSDSNSNTSSVASSHDDSNIMLDTKEMQNVMEKCLKEVLPEMLKVNSQELLNNITDQLKTIMDGLLNDIRDILKEEWLTNYIVNVQDLLENIQQAIFTVKDHQEMFTKTGMENIEHIQIQFEDLREKIQDLKKRVETTEKSIGKDHAGKGGKSSLLKRKHSTKQGGSKSSTKEARSDPGSSTDPRYQPSCSGMGKNNNMAMANNLKQ